MNWNMSKEQATPAGSGKKRPEATDREMDQGESKRILTFSRWLRETRERAAEVERSKRATEFQRRMAAESYHYHPLASHHQEQEKKLQEAQKAAAEVERAKELERRREKEEVAQPSSAQAATSASTEEGKDCVVCLIEPKTHVFVPCGHMCICAACEKKLIEPKQCPVCRAEVVMACRVFN